VTNNDWFSKFSTSLSSMAGKPATFVIAVALVIVWGVSGPMFHFSDTWQLVINTSTTIVTFLMVFLIQNTQNRDTAAMQIKLDELIRALDGAHNALLDLEELNEKELTRFRRRYEQLAEDARKALRSGGVDTDSPFIDERDESDDDDEGPRRDNDSARRHTKGS
jgi:low affinity Fe/Cu permease